MSQNEEMNEFAKLSSSSPAQRLNSRITIVYANGRDFDHRERLENLSRKAIHDQEEMERKIKKTQKWNLRAEKNIMIKEIYNRPANGGSSDALTPSIDEWLKMSKKRRIGSTSSDGNSNPSQGN